MEEQEKQSQDTPVQQEIAQEKQQVPVPPSSNSKLLISVVVLALIIAGGAGVYFFTTQKSDSENVFSNAERIADFTKYRTAEHGFEFGYNSNKFELSERYFDNSKSNAVSILNTRIDDKKVEYLQKRLRITIYPRLSQEEKERMRFSRTDFPYLLILSMEPTSIVNDLSSFIRKSYPYPVKLRTKEINGIEFVQVIREDTAQNDTFALVLYNVTPNNFIWQIEYYIDTDFIDSYGKDFDGIISTFTPI